MVGPLGPLRHRREGVGRVDAWPPLAGDRAGSVRGVARDRNSLRRLAEPAIGRPVHGFHPVLRGGSTVASRPRSGVGSAWIADPWAPALSLSRAPLDFEVSTPALPAFPADVGFVGEVPDPLRVALSP